MPAPIRALLVVLAITAAFFAGAFYFGYRNTSGPSADRSDWGQLASLHISLPGEASEDDQLLRLALHQLERTYYKPVDPQTLISGERTGLLLYLKDTLKKKAVKPTLPALSASTETQALNALGTELAYARSHYAPLGVAPNDLTQAALKGMARSLGDPYTEYLTPREIGALNEELNGGDFGGIGVFIVSKDNQIILQPIPDLPASRAGMHDVEVVESIDGQSVRGFTLDRAERMIRGPEGTQVTLKTHPYKGTVSHTYRVTREIIHVPTVRQKMEDGYDYIRLSDFGQTSAAEIHKALLQGKAQHAKGYILDLRFNGGGLLDAAVNISSYFVPQGTIVTEIDRDGVSDTKLATGAYVAGLRPLVVLVNAYTASASEITAGALHDYHVATLVGERTFGKGVVQGIYTMPNGGALKITTERYVTPSGRDIQHKGISPDVTVSQKLDVNLVDTPGDKQLQAAKTLLHRQSP
ncbi:MAG TPA: S41 family peptidase [Candidatus Rubrimentiphilum sp.]|nr:S41 family peptidase [Candidatus Rubrimentiphilum sp.]